MSKSTNGPAMSAETTANRPSISDAHRAFLRRRIESMRQLTTQAADLAGEIDAGRHAATSTQEMQALTNALHADMATYASDIADTLRCLHDDAEASR